MVSLGHFYYIYIYTKFTAGVGGGIRRRRGVGGVMVTTEINEVGMGGFTPTVTRERNRYHIFSNTPRLSSMNHYLSNVHIHNENWVKSKLHTFVSLDDNL